MFFIISTHYFYDAGTVHGGPERVGVYLKIVSNVSKIHGNRRVHLAESIAYISVVSEAEKIEGRIVSHKGSLVENEQLIIRVNVLVFTYLNFLTREFVVIGGDNDFLDVILYAAGKHCGQNAAENQQCNLFHLS